MFGEPALQKDALSILNVIGGDHSRDFAIPQGRLCKVLLQHCFEVLMRVSLLQNATRRA